jgi:arylsulfatase A-like enzyme
VLISIDTLSPRRMSTYGSERPTTPTIDALAQESLLFNNAFSTSSWTLPAHASMFTGRYPTSLAPDPNDNGLYLAAPLLSGMFKQKGYRTAAFASTGWVGKRLGPNRGNSAI